MDTRSTEILALDRRPLRVGIVGAGLMGRWHAVAARKAQGNLVAVADRNLDMARRLAGQYRNVEAYPDVEQLLSRTSCDLIHICTPLATHEQIAARAIEARAHVLVEKPVTSEADGTERLIQLAAQRHVLICPVHQFVFQDGVRKAHRLLDRIGTVVYLDATFCSAGGIGRQERDLDALVAEILPHPLSLLQLFLPGHTIPDAWQILRPRPGEFRAITDTGSVTASLTVSLQSRPTQCMFQIVGTAGTIHLDLFHGYSFMEPGAVSKGRKILRPFDLSTRRFVAASANLVSRAIHRDLAYPGLTRLVAELYEAVRTGRPAPITQGALQNIARVRDLLSGTGTHS